MNHVLLGRSENYSLPKKACAPIGDWYSVSVLYVYFFLRRSKLLLKLVNIGHLHSVHQGKSL